MKRLLTIFALAVATSCVAFGQTDSKKQDERQLIKLGRELANTLTRGDVTPLRKIIAADFKLASNSDLCRTKAQCVAAIESGEWFFESITLDDLQVELHDNMAAMTGRWTAKGKHNGIDLDKNRREHKAEQVKEKWLDVEKLLRRRADLVPELYEAAKAAGVVENEIFGALAIGRSHLLNAIFAVPPIVDGDKSAGQKQAIDEADKEFATALKRFLTVADSYSQLLLSKDFQRLEDEIAGTENRLAVARGDYDEAVKDYNVSDNTLSEPFTAVWIKRSGRWQILGDQPPSLIP